MPPVHRRQQIDLIDTTQHFPSGAASCGDTLVDRSGGQTRVAAARRPVQPSGARSRRSKNRALAWKAQPGSGPRNRSKQRDSPQRLPFYYGGPGER